VCRTKLIEAAGCEKRKTRELEWMKWSCPLLIEMRQPFSKNSYKRLKSLNSQSLYKAWPFTLMTMHDHAFSWTLLLWWKRAIRCPTFSFRFLPCRTANLLRNLFASSLVPRSKM
jgi:hypothetical protein